MISPLTAALIACWIVAASAGTRIVAASLAGATHRASHIRHAADTARDNPFDGEATIRVLRIRRRGDGNRWGITSAVRHACHAAKIGFPSELSRETGRIAAAPRLQFSR